MSRALGWLILAALALLALAYAAALRTAMLIEARRHAQALEEQRGQLEREFADTRRAIEDSANGLAAALGQIDDKLERRP